MVLVAGNVGWVTLLAEMVRVYVGTVDLHAVGHSGNGDKEAEAPLGSRPGEWSSREESVPWGICQAWLSPVARKLFIYLKEIKVQQPVCL